MKARYRESLSPKKRQALDASTADAYDKARGKMKGIPKFVLTMMASPYVLGESLTTVAAEDGGNAAVDALLRAPPHHEAVLLDPFRASDEADARTVDVPKLRAGEKKFDSGEFGAVTWYFMLAEQLPLVDALETLDGWGGDAYVAFERDGRSCVRAAYAGDTGGNTAHMLAALQRWSRGKSTASVSRDGDTVIFESCDPGTKVTGGRDTFGDAFNLAACR